MSQLAFIDEPGSAVVGVCGGSGQIALVQSGFRLAGDLLVGLRGSGASISSCVRFESRLSAFRS